MPLPRRRRRLQADQRHLRASARRPGARRGRASCSARADATASAPSASAATSSQCVLALRRDAARTPRRGALPRHLGAPSSRTAPPRRSASGIATFPEQAAGRRRARARRRQRALLGEAARQEPLLRSTARRSPRRHAPDELERRVEHRRGCVRRRTSSASSTRRTSTRAAHSERVALLVEAIARRLGLDDEHGRAAEARRAAPRPRQDRDPRPRAAEARRLDADEERQLRAPPRARASLLDGMDIRAGRRLDPAPPRALGRLRLPARARGRGDPVRLADHPRRRRIRRDHDRAQLPRGGDARRRRWSSCARTRASSSTRAVVDALEAHLEDAGGPSSAASSSELHRRWRVA